MASILSAACAKSCRLPSAALCFKPQPLLLSRRTSAARSRGNIIPLKHYSTSPESPSQKVLPLDGVTVVSLEHAIAAPFCTRQLADLGARVIKVERPGEGDFARNYDTRVRGLASHFVWTNRSKESLALDVKNPRDFKVLKALLAKADVLVQNLAPGASQRLGLSFDALKDENPGLIVCDISGYGSNGPYRDKKAYDLLVQSEAGLVSVTGTEAEPAKVGISIADISAGTFAFQNILAALLKRGKTGKGSHIDISMLEAMAEWMSFPLYYAFDGAPGPKRAGASHAAIYPYGPFDTANGGTVMMGLQNEREWAKLCTDVLEKPDLAKDERFITNSLRSQNRKALREMICAAFSSLSPDAVLEKLDKAGIANAKVNDMQGVWDHPQLRARGRWTEVDTPAGKVPALLPPGVADAGSARMDAVPALGEHNDAIFKELGFSR
ncbi:transferase family III [Fusarium albosuccineum]|uniref:Transferase family III n=1 Tax=Fusarium albosuccineum TaxID=1237068 RepID=A0A8H4PA28_9HYPO|nr:transferase family III [Fusarium albosuccineum]